MKTFWSEPNWGTLISRLITVQVDVRSVFLLRFTVWTETRRVSQKDGITCQITLLNSLPMTAGTSEGWKK